MRQTACLVLTQSLLMAALFYCGTPWAFHIIILFGYQGKKGLIFEKKVKNLLRNHKVDEADTLHICL